jgi:hypothetical protein
MSRKTTVSIDGEAFCIDGEPTYAGRSWRGMKIEGLLLNSRMVQGIFDDLNDETRHLWDYPDGPWDPDRNTAEFVAAMADWRAAGLASFTINIQGGSPQGYSKHQPWHNSGFAGDGSLRPEYMARLERILDAADDLGMAPIVGLFYFGQDQRLTDEAAVIAAADNAIDWLIGKGYANVLIEIGNEVDHPKYVHDIIRASRGEELIRRVQQRSAGKVDSPAGRLLVSTSMCGGKLPPDNVVAAADFVLMHGNGVGEPDGVRDLVRRCRATGAYRGQPIVINEDDHFAFDAEDNNFLAAVGEYAGWGYFDFRMEGEGFEEGYQSVPVNWGICSDRKRGFFGLLAEITGPGGSP